jgi:hypothetical protein
MRPRKILIDDDWNCGEQLIKKGKMKAIGGECSCLQKKRNDAIDLDVTKICENAYLIMHKMYEFGFHNTPPKQAHFPNVIV